MAEYLITSPEGQKYRITAPDDATEQDIMGYVQSNIGGMQETQSGQEMQNPADIYNKSGLQNASDPAEAQQILADIPEDQRDLLRDQWAEQFVSRERTKRAESPIGGILQTIDDRIRQFGDYIPIAGSYTDEANAYLNSLFGGDYPMELSIERAIKKTVHKGDEEPLIETPVGDIYTSGLFKTGGAIAGSMAAPFAKVFQAGTKLGQVGNAALTGSIYGGAEAFGEGEGGAQERLEQGTKGAITGGLVGGALGRLTAGKPAKGIAKETEEAAGRLGIDLPRVVATGDNPYGFGVRATGASLREIPGVGSPLSSATQRAEKEIISAADDIAKKLSKGGSIDPALSGQAVKDSISEWVTGKSSKVLNRMYGGVNKLIPQGQKAPLTKTESMSGVLQALDKESASSVNKPVIDLVQEAVDRNATGGMTFQGAQQLRTNIGAMIDDALLPNAGTVKPGLKRMYGALTEDLENMVRTNGGQKALNAWKRANEISKIASSKRENLAKIIGKKGEAAPENVVDRLITMAGTNRTADIQKLLQAKKTVGSDVWGELSGSAINRLGRNQANEFNIAQFLKRYSALSKNGRNALFSQSGLSKELDDLSLVMDRLQKFQNMRNFSGTGRVVSLIGAGATATQAGIVPTIMAALTGLAGSTFLARSSNVRPLRRYLENVLELISGPKSVAISQAATKNSAAMLAKELAKDSNMDEKQIRDALILSYGGTP